MIFSLFLLYFTINVTEYRYIDAVYGIMYFQMKADEFVPKNGQLNFQQPGSTLISWKKELGGLDKSFESSFIFPHFLPF